MPQWVDQAIKKNPPDSPAEGAVFVLGNEQALDSVVNTYNFSSKFKSRLTRGDAITECFEAERCYWVVRPYLTARPTLKHDGRLQPSPYGSTRDALGGLLSALKAQDLKTLSVRFIACSREHVIGGLVGLNLGAYKFLPSLEEGKRFEGPSLSLEADNLDIQEMLAEVSAVSMSVNLARHLTNLPANLINPTSLSQKIAHHFASSKTVEVDILNEKRLQKEGMELLLGVGRGSETPPCLVHLKYRQSQKSKVRPVAFVGKGITFDSGGYDLKPSSGMRWMKKDMAGAAALLAVCAWAEKVKYPAPIDFYLSLAENMVDSKAFRPGDVLKSRKGLTVEIHNTDAEGRLVLADALDYAVQGKPELVINVATLTGAIKVALGADLAGLFSNDDDLAGDLESAAQAAGEPCWRMPLVQKYRSSLNSTFANMVNATDGFGGAITAALFLESFVGEVPWAHLDIYGWKDSAEGPYSEMGASGQPVQMLIRFLLTRFLKGRSPSRGSTF